MTANINVKEYLMQTYRLNSLIETDLEDIQRLRELAVSATSTLSATPAGVHGDSDKTGSVIVKIIGLEMKINDEISRLVDLKIDIREKISGLNNRDYRLILMKRYILFKSWEQIAVDLHYSRRHILRLHGRALCVLEKMMSLNVT